MLYMKIFEDFNLFPNSKMRDKKGKLEVYYHGVGPKGKFKEFDSNLIGTTSGNYGHYGKGFYFTDTYTKAEIFSEMFGGTGEVLKVYLNIINPFILNETNLIYIGEKYNLNLPNKIPVAIDINDLLNKLRTIDMVAYNLLYLLNIYGNRRGWELFMKNNNPGDSNIDLNNVTDWYDETKKERYDTGINVHIIEELKEIGIIPEYIYDYEENINMAYLTNLGQHSEEWTNSIKKEGYDGIDAGDEIVAFEKEQIYIINA